MANSVRSQPIGDPPCPGSPLRRCGRSSVVFTEGVDSGPLDRGNAPEACEIGGLGTLGCGACRTKRSRGRCRAVPQQRVRLDRSVTNSGRGSGPLAHSTRASCWALWPGACKTVTWLILPVVICLSQRLSHACLSINKSIL